ncbi:MAG: M13 family metallopeptidase [Chloroflexota bacterium]|nr:M13 family metallopeptidase [Chloroflexota bacterium]MDE3102382.1 M13 family metallopeptidase [Chloroflexota bacterium]
MAGIDVSQMDTAVSPCDDFFRYANGTWLDRTEIPPEEATWGGFIEVRERNLAILRVAADEAAAAAAPKGSVEQKVGDYWASGMDEAAIEAADIGPLDRELELIGALTERARLAGTLARLHREGAGQAGMVVSVRQDPGDSSRNVVWLQQGGLGLPDRDYYVKDDARSREIRVRYVAHVARMLELLGDDADDARYGAATVLGIETRLARASMTRVDQRDPYRTYNKLTLAELDARAVGFDWRAYFVALGAPEPGDLNVRQPAFASELAAALGDTPLEQLRTYLRWHLVLSAASALPKRFVDELFDFYQRELMGVREQRPRWKRILESMDAHIGQELGQLYVRRAFSPEAKRRVLELVDDLRSVLRDRIGTLEWMGEETKALARTKLDAFGVKMAYPDTWRDHSALEVVRGEHLRNVFRAREWHLARDLAKLGQPVDRTEWLMSPQTVNAYYSPLMNEIVFPAGILQPPFFDPEADDAVNYGAIGMVIGHEMSHGFDDQGSKYDARGDLKEWWTPEDRAAYASRQDLVVSQYEGYEPLPGQRINGRLTLGENIGDIGGIRVAWAAFQRMLSRKGPRQRIDGFTPEQRFFLGMAQSWRNKIRDEALRVRLSVDPHSPSVYRVLGPLSNMPEFHEAFGCTAGSRMWREEKLRPAIW